MLRLPQGGELDARSPNPLVLVLVERGDRFERVAQEEPRQTVAVGWGGMLGDPGRGVRDPTPSSVPNGHRPLMWWQREEDRMTGARPTTGVRLHPRPGADNVEWTIGHRSDKRERPDTPRYQVRLLLHGVV